MNEDELASLISEEQAKLLKRKLIVKKELIAIDKELGSLERELKENMRNSDIKTIESHGLKITYTKPRDYEEFRNKSFAIKVIKEIRPDLLEIKSGYDRLIITKMRE